MNRKRAKVSHDCTKDVAVQNARFVNYLAKCRGDCSPFHANLLAFVVAHSALQSILDADGPEMARGALKGCGDLLEDAIKLHGVENGTRH
jgi:hypothetical protein